MKCVMFLLYLCLAVWKIEAHPSVDFIVPCRRSDKKCLLESSNIAFDHVSRGVPGLNISFTPLVMDDVIGDSGELKLKFKHVEVYDLDKCIIIDVGRDDPLKISIELHCPFKLIADVVMSGKLGIVDVDGEDKCEIKTAKMIFKLVINLKIVKKDGVEYYKITGFDYSYEPVEKVYFKLNGHNGDKAKASVIEEFLDTNWKDVITTMGQPICKEMMTRSIFGISPLITEMPINKLELPEL